MKVGVLGSGVVGQVLGGGFAARGHEVRLGTRDPGRSQIRSWMDRLAPRATAGSFAQAAEFGEMTVLATQWSGTENAIRMAGPKNLAGKVVIDATNPLVSHEGGPPTLALGWSDSGGEQVQRWLADSRVVKAFNIVGNVHMINPQFPGGPPDMFLCGNDADAKKQVAAICESFGWPSVIDIGGIEGARYLEPLAMIWILEYVRTGSPAHAWKLLRR